MTTSLSQDLQMILYWVFFFCDFFSRTHQVTTTWLLTTTTKHHRLCPDGLAFIISPLATSLDKQRAQIVHIVSLLASIRTEFPCSLLFCINTPIILSKKIYLNEPLAWCHLHRTIPKRTEWAKQCIPSVLRCRFHFLSLSI